MRKTNSSLATSAAWFSLLDPNKIHVMGILNLHPQSFNPTGRYSETSSAIDHALKMQAEGASIIDIGAEPTHPLDHVITDADTELTKLLPVIQGIRAHSAIPISIDTSDPTVMTACIDAGANCINDVRALTKPGALETVAALKVPVCLMHMRYLSGEIPAPSHEKSVTDIIKVVTAYLKERVDAAINAGIIRDAIMIDPGFGAGAFGKTTQDNLILLNQLHTLVGEFPLLAGVSQKIFIGDVLQKPVTERLFGSIAAAVIAVMKGAWIIRAHDVRAHVDAIQLTELVVGRDKTNEHE